MKKLYVVVHNSIGYDYNTDTEDLVTRDILYFLTEESAMDCVFNHMKNDGATFTYHDANMVLNDPLYKGTEVDRYAIETRELHQ